MMAWKIAGSLEVKVEVADPSADPGGRWDEALWDNNENWSAVEPTWTDITEYVYGVPQLTRGRDFVEDRMRTGQAVILLDNDTALFNPLESSAETPIRPGRWARVSTRVTYSDPVETFAGGESWPDVAAGGTIIAVGAGVELHAGGGNLGWLPQLTGTIDTITERYEGGARKIVTEIAVFDFLAAFNQINPPERELPERAGDTADERVGWILDEIPWFYTRDLDVCSLVFQATTLARPYLEELQSAAASEGGVLYVDGAGTVILRSNQWPDSDRSAAVQYRVGWDGSTVGLLTSEPSWSLRRIYNDVVFQRANGDPQRVRDSASRALYGFQSFTETGLVNDNDGDVLALAQAFTDRQAEDRFRFELVELWPTSAVAMERLLWSNLLDRIDVTARTLRGWEYQREVFINRITYQISPDDIAMILRVDDAYSAPTI